MRVVQHPIGGMGQSPPVDKFDQCYKDHDICYNGCPDGKADTSHCDCLKGRPKSRCRDKARTKARQERVKCLKLCDKALKQCLKNAGPGGGPFRMGAENLPLWWFSWSHFLIIC